MMKNYKFIMAILLLIAAAIPASAQYFQEDCLYLVGTPTEWASPNSTNQELYDNWKLERSDFLGEEIYKGEFDIPAGDLQFRLFSKLDGWQRDCSIGAGWEDFINEEFTEDEFKVGQKLMTNGLSNFQWTGFEGGKLYFTVFHSYLAVSRTGYVYPELNYVLQPGYKPQICDRLRFMDFQIENEQGVYVFLNEANPEKLNLQNPAATQDATWLSVPEGSEVSLLGGISVIDGAKRAQGAPKMIKFGDNVDYGWYYITINEEDGYVAFDNYEYMYLSYTGNGNPQITYKNYTEYLDYAVPRSTGTKIVNCPAGEVKWAMCNPRFNNLVVTYPEVTLVNGVAKLEREGVGCIKNWKGGLLALGYYNVTDMSEISNYQICEASFNNDTREYDYKFTPLVKNSDGKYSAKINMNWQKIDGFSLLSKIDESNYLTYHPTSGVNQSFSTINLVWVDGEANCLMDPYQLTDEYFSWGRMRVSDYSWQEVAMSIEYDPATRNLRIVPDVPVENTWALINARNMDGSNTASIGYLMSDYVGNGVRGTIFVADNTTWFEIVEMGKGYVVPSDPAAFKTMRPDANGVMRAKAKYVASTAKPAGARWELAQPVKEGYGLWYDTNTDEVVMTFIPQDAAGMPTKLFLNGFYYKSNSFVYQHLTPDCTIANAMSGSVPTMTRVPDDNVYLRMAGTMTLPSSETTDDGINVAFSGLLEYIHGFSASFAPFRVYNPDNAEMMDFGNNHEFSIDIPAQTPNSNTFYGGGGVISMTNFAGGNLYIEYVQEKEEDMTGTLTLKLNPAGVDGIITDADAEGEAVYYNLQGVRVQNPEKGIYVRVRAGKAEKVTL